MPNANTAKEPNHQVTSGELRGRWMQAKNLAETYKREKEAMVIKYAQSEQKRFQLEQQIHSLECKISRLVNTNNLEQLKQQTNESEQNHITDKSSPKKQAYKTTANSSSTEKTNSNEKFSMEHIQKELATARERIDALLKKQSTDESRITSLTSKLSQVQESLKSEQKKSSSLNDNLNRVNKSLENALKQAKEAERLREREAERLCSEVALQEAQATIKQVQGENDSLKQQLKDLENVKCDYEKSQSRIQELTNELSSSSDMKLELQSCKHRIDELSDFTRRLTERNTNLQAEHLVTLNSLEEVKHQLAEKDEEIIQLNEKYESERNQLQVKINTLQREFDDLYVKLNQLNDSENLLRIQLKEEKQRATAMHKRDAARIKDIAREVTRCLSSHHYNNNSKMNPTDFCQSMLSSNSIDVVNHDTNSDPKSCRNSLNGSLKSLDLSQIPTEPENDKTGSPSFTVEHRTTDRLDSLSSPNNTPSQNDNSLEQITGEITNKLECSERDALLLKIDRLQRIQVKLTDKLEFFQEHCYQLTEELNKKSKIIQNLLVTSDKRCGDNYNNNNNPNRKMKASNHKHTSIISSFKTTRTTDSEICRQEIDEKLQTVLENTMFKNITLKENLHTLGSEISSLRLNHERVLNSLCQQCKLANQSMHKTPTKLNQIHLSNNNNNNNNNSNNSYSAKIKSEPPIFQNGGMSA
uniref:Uncharacterized protein n=1 Tax=Trichobilharzia regenti TaxID=157069 RepID=A0AA85JZP8_TRIRE|nr:unnamed protein product [Trichobilharzia regenti]